jgi:hypothetical protein
MIGKAEALFSLAPSAKWILRGDVLEWIDTIQTQPTEEEIQAEIVRLQAEHEAKQYQRNRAAEYPSFASQFDLLYHGGYDAWKAAIDEIKNKYPKPE